MENGRGSSNGVLRVSHLNIVARDVDRLAEFYRRVFGCQDLRPPRELSGKAVDRGIGLRGAKIRSVWLSLPGAVDMFLELFEFAAYEDRPAGSANSAGYAHVAFEVEDLQAAHEGILQAGGSALGEVTNLGSDETPYFAVYMRDPEGNIIELEGR
ncbi:Glyoxalase-like domain protein [Falsiruegeria litorea R37]|uniref:Glyoxalase-like domain protein n=1 Tax=Falsiruegeria litorea R37 TaxID=1200284 RepID=A0A1Y5R9G2_9RHOB|nr:VOC family protein [Falsiruegeria litorea]SLN12225.1 Glyoxalase-like domain protein [Falsiruegeria litorea R37]